MSDKPIEGHAYIMSMANEIISLRAERDELRAELAAARKRYMTAHLRNGVHRNLLREAYERLPKHMQDRIDDALKEKNHAR